MGFECSTNKTQDNADLHCFILKLLGELYTVRIIYVVQPLGSDKEVESEALTGNFLTKPLPPSNFRIGEEENQISFHKSATPSIK